MINMRVAAIAALGFVLGGQPVVAQAPFKYREYALQSHVASVVTISAARATDIKTLHERPALIQELEWRAPYVGSGTESADPVREVVFSFYDDQLYQVVVVYDRERMEGLTNDDVIESLSATYGLPLLRHGKSAVVALPTDVMSDTKIVAQWEDPTALLTLSRSTYSPQFQLVLIAKAMNAQARAAIKESLRLDTREAPQRELDQRKKDVADAQVANQKARVINKAAFRP